MCGKETKKNKWGQTPMNVFNIPPQTNLTNFLDFYKT